MTPGMTYFRGARIASVPQRPGIYAWYYKPRVNDWETVCRQLQKLLESNGTIDVVARFRYGMALRGSSRSALEFGANNQSVSETLNTLDETDRALFMSFLSQDSIIACTKPLYIGISRNLNQRVYREHYMRLETYWEDSSIVSRYLRANPEASIEETVSTLNLGHSFALEARIRDLAPRDLLVYAFPIESVNVANGKVDLANEAEIRRKLERVLQLMTDPICGVR